MLESSSKLETESRSIMYRVHILKAKFSDSITQLNGSICTKIMVSRQSD